MTHPDDRDPGRKDPGSGDGGGRDDGLPARRPRRSTAPLKPGNFEGRPNALALVEQLRAVVDADPDRTRGQVAVALNVSPSELSKMLSGDRPLQRATVEQIAHLCAVTDEVRAHLLRSHTAVIGEAFPRLRARLELADAYDEAVVHQRRSEARYDALAAEHHRLQADHQAALARERRTRDDLAALEASSRRREEEHRAALADLTHRLDHERARATTQEDLDEALVRAGRLREELDEQRLQVRATYGELLELGEEVADARRERDQARTEAGQLRDELLDLRTHLVRLEGEQDGAQGEDAMVGQALRTVDDALDHEPTTPGTASAVVPGPVPGPAAGSSEAGVGSVAGGATGAPPAGGPRPGQVVRPDGGRSRGVWLWLAAVCGVVGVALAAVGMVSQRAASAAGHGSGPSDWIIGGGLLAIAVGGIFVLVYLDDGQGEASGPGGFSA
ncbi:helix-turn-helix domain-containing protein [Kitasatospora herbaricolor]|uniref:Helix-turn-helix domain-containing protein n=1 Tax=Kitasatospora herbaricolor TaxID=68217 RepID=A0ABZ1WK18_9ACTN|nr:helix-turn-helix domain-containing protein [Kitasatospora herbaricolor]